MPLNLISKQSSADIINDKLLRIEELLIMANERKIIAEERYAVASNNADLSRNIAIASNGPGKVIRHAVSVGAQILPNESPVSVINCENLFIDLILDESSVEYSRVGDVISFYLSGTSKIWQAQIAEKPTNIDLFDAKLKSTLPPLPRGHWYRIRAIPEAAFISTADHADDCWIGRSVVASVPNVRYFETLRTLWP